MTYRYDLLGDEDFQRLAQSLIAADYPRAQLLPVGMPDGGRDAFVRRWDENKPDTVFQIKYSKTPSTKSERDAVLECIETESKKITNLMAKGLKKYVLITNVGGTSHAASGSIDLANALLQNQFPGIETECWWKDDLDARLRLNSDLVWSFPKIATGLDVLSVIAKNNNEETLRRSRAVKALISDQYTNDEEVKFKEIELRFPVSDIYVDTPIMSVDNRDGHAGSETYRADASPALACLLAVSNDEEHVRILIEGAPGQGKSTVTQFLCQVNRGVFLQKEGFLERLPKRWRPKTLRVPIRADLRDYATWLQGQSPFGAQRGSARIGDQSLDSFLAALVSFGAGGIPFDVNDLHASFEGIRLLLVLDGFDEVADPDTRVAMAREVNACLGRLEATCLSVHALVTTRPSALITTPVFNDKNWSTFELQNLSGELAKEYAEKWAKIKRLSSADAEELLEILTHKIEEPHIRELARNPMQLAILATLINIQSDSLPSKRTALYADYIRIFFDRESQKSSLVKAHRSLLIMIHEYLAFYMHCESEYESRNKDRRPGSLSLDEVKQKISTFLEHRGSKPDLLDGLFSAVQERVVALVQNVQGTYEFQVQPLREFFAAQYLYKSAVTRPGIVPGSRPDIYAGISGSPYWENVTRFYAGCYNAGEIASLIEDTLSQSENLGLHRTTFLVERLSNFLRDFVFETHPRLITRAVTEMTEQTPLDVHLSIGVAGRGGGDQAIPPACGSAEYLRILESKIDYADNDRVVAFARILKANTGWSGRVDFYNRVHEASGRSPHNLLDWVLDILDDAPLEDLEKMLEEGGPERIRYASFAERHDFFQAPSREQETLRHMLNGDLGASFELSGQLGKIGLALSPHVIRAYTRHQTDLPLLEFIRRYYAGYFDPNRIASGGTTSIFDRDTTEKLDELADFIGDDPLRLARTWGLALAQILNTFGLQPAVFSAIARWTIEVFELGDHASEVPEEFDLFWSAYSNRSDSKWWSQKSQGLDTNGQNVLARLYFTYCAPLLCEDHDDRLFQIFENLESIEQESSRGLLRVMPDPSAVEFSYILPKLAAYPKSASHIVESLDEHERLVASQEALRSGLVVFPEFSESVFETIFTSALNGTIGWPDAIEAGKHLRSLGGVGYGISGRGNAPLPLDLASSILDDTGIYPLSLVHVAQQAITSAAAQRVEKVSEIALAHDWFSQN